MDTFDYLAVLFSVILGLALTQILQGFRTLMLKRKRVRLYTPALIWPAAMVFLVAQAWWGMFQLRLVADWSFAMYGAVVLQMVLIYLAAGLALDDLPPEGPIDLRAEYFAHARWFFALIALVIVSTLLKDWIITGQPTSGWNAAYFGVFFVLSAIAALTQSRWYHWILAPFGVTLTAAYTIMFSSHL